MMGSSSLATKLRITCRMVSVDITVEMPRRLPSKDERVLLPVPEVPASSTKIFLLDSIYLMLVNKYEFTYGLNLRPHKSPSDIQVVNTYTSQPDTS